MSRPFRRVASVIPPHDTVPYPSYPYTLPTATVDPQSLFRSVETDRSGYITASGLQNALRNRDWGAFEIDTIKLLMNMFDTKGNGTLDINEFDGLWKYIKAWEGVFRRFDTSHQGAINGDELRQAMEQFGYSLSPPLQDLLKRKYDVPWGVSGDGPAAALPRGHSPQPLTAFYPPDPLPREHSPPPITTFDLPAAPPGGRSSSSRITFDRFMRACVVIKQLKESFEALDRDAYGRVKIDFDTLLKIVLKLP